MLTFEKALENGEKITGADAVFYTHEMKEAELVASGMKQIAAHRKGIAILWSFSL